MIAIVYETVQSYVRVIPRGGIENQPIETKWMVKIILFWMVFFIAFSCIIMVKPNCIRKEYPEWPKVWKENGLSLQVPVK
ncbi:MAG: hypothetical protein K0S39_1143 [Paenibacillus sp.]|jgi:hypothetical protein|nr:hypothetical protein [Paenibacillus sp.]